VQVVEVTSLPAGLRGPTSNGTGLSIAVQHRASHHRLDGLGYGLVIMALADVLTGQCRPTSLRSC